MKWFRRDSLITALLLCSCIGWGYPAEDGPREEARRSAGDVVEELYRLVTFDAGTTPDWGKVRSLFVEEAVVVLRTGRDKMTVFSLDGFVNDFVQFIEESDVRKTGFTERILRTKTTVYGDIAHVLVLFDSRIKGSENEARPGIDSFQLIRRAGEWRIVSVTNDRPSPSNPIPSALFDPPDLSGPYLGQEPPGQEAVLFAPGVISTGLHDDAGPSFTRGGREVLFRIAGNPFGIVGTMKEEDGKWSRPALASFSGHYPDGISDFSADGNWIVFSSRRPLSGEGEPVEKSNLWMVTRTPDGWGAPELLPDPISTREFDEYMGAIADDGSIYFARRSRVGDVTGFETFHSKRANGVYQEPEPVEIPHDPQFMTIGGFMSPDASYMLLSIRGHPDGYGAEDIHVSFRNSDQSWGEPINLGPEINSEDTDWMPRVTRDGKYLFFVSWRYDRETWSEKERTFEELIALKRSAQYGWGADIYWASTAAIEKLRPSDAADVRPE